MQKAFLRAPVASSRICSGFNLHRKHPILKFHPRPQGRGLRGAHRYAGGGRR